MKKAPNHVANAVAVEVGSGPGERDLPVIALQLADPRARFTAGLPGL